MKEYAFTKWLVPTLQADGTERDMVYNEQMGIFTVRGENQFQKGSIDTQHTVSLLVLKGEISIQTNDKRTVIPAPSYIEFIEPHQWSDLKTNRDFEGCLLITRREIFLQAAECIRSKVSRGKRTARTRCSRAARNSIQLATPGTCRLARAFIGCNARSVAPGPAHAGAAYSRSARRWLRHPAAGWPRPAPRR